MLGKWRTHEVYQRSLLETLTIIKRNNAELFTDIALQEAIQKVCLMNLDTVKEDFFQLFSHTGRPSNYQPELFRSYILMTHFRYFSIDKWHDHAASHLEICAMIGVTPDNLPGASTMRDFITRLWLTDEPNHIRLAEKKPTTKYGKDKKPPKRPGIVSEMVGEALNGKVFGDIPESLLQTIFNKIAVFPSAGLSLLGDTNNLFTSGDGTCVLSHASPYGHKICNCIGMCSCERRFADPIAGWGWDSYHEKYFFGYSAYILSVHNPSLHIDLPIYMRFESAGQHDSVSLISSLAHARSLFSCHFKIKGLLADSAHDNYPTYDLLNQWGIAPFIDLNGRRSDLKPQSDYIQFSDNGVPICTRGTEMTNWGYDHKKRRIKYRCPEAAGSICSCEFSDICNNTEYGKIVYVRTIENLRLFTPVPRGSIQWKQTYKQRTAAERVNTRMLTDYYLEPPKRYGLKKLCFFAFTNLINIHLDVQIKSDDTSFQTPRAWKEAC